MIRSKQSSLENSSRPSQNLLQEYAEEQALQRMVRQMNLKKQKKQEEQDTVTVALTKELKTKMNVKVVEQHEVDSYEDSENTS